MPHSTYCQEACDAFLLTRSAEELWAQLHRHMARFGITGMVFGTEAMSDPERNGGAWRLNAMDDGWFTEKLARGLFYQDECVQAARCDLAPILWRDAAALAPDTKQARQSLAVDHDFGVITGITLPMRFGGGLGMSGLGCHAAGMSFAEFDRVWLENRQAILGIANTFDVHLRRDHIGDVFPLSRRERECLLWLAAGLRPKQIAYRLGTQYKTVEKQINSARKKLRATSVAQTVATALVFGLIAP